MHSITLTLVNTNPPFKFYHWNHPLNLAETFSQKELDKIKSVIKPGDYVIDIGAYTGDTTIPYAIAAGESGFIAAFEPNPLTRQVLDENIKVNNLGENVEVYPFAVSNESGRKSLSYTGNMCNGGFGAVNGPEPLEANCLTLDEFYYNWCSLKPSLIKIDTEGHELDILLNAEKLIKNSRPKLILELFIVLDEQKRKDLWNWLESHRYKVFVYYFPTDETRHGKELGVLDFLASYGKHMDLLCVPVEKCEV